MDSNESLILRVLAGEASESELEKMASTKRKGKPEHKSKKK